MPPTISAGTVFGLAASGAVRFRRPAARRHAALRASSALTGAALVGSMLMAGQAWALPQGGTVVEGDATITYGETSVVIEQNSSNVIIEWDSFDTTAGEAVHFDQAAFMAALNRILSGEATRFDGALTANGSITIVNQAGIAFGAGASVDVGAITATTLDILNSNFMADDLVFDQYDPAFANASVTNDGMITVADQGLAALVGPGVANNGVIQARTGAVVLASGTAATIDFYGDGLINFALTGATEAAPVDADGNPLDALVGNDGAIYADGGTVILAAEAVGAIVDNAINMDGVVQARSIEGRSGQIALVAGEDAGAVQVAGTLDAAATDAGVSGGTVHVLGDQVALNAGADVNVSGPAGGGEALIGGAFQGGAASLAELAPAAGNALHYERTADVTRIVADPGLEIGAYALTSDVTYFDADAAVDASASAGEGGSVIVWGNEHVAFHGAIDTTGGAGGFVEVSTKGTGSADGTAATGHFLLDPGDVCVTTGGGTSLCAALAVNVADTTIVGVLNGGGLFELNTDIYGTSGTGRVDFGGGGNFIVTNNTGAMGTFRIHAADTINTRQVGFLSNGTTGTNYEWYAGSSSTGAPVSSADIIQGAQVFNTGGGHVIRDAADDISINDPLRSGGGDVTLIARGGSGGSTVTIGASGNTADDHIDTTDGSGGAGAVTITADNLALTGVSDPIIDANGTGGVVTLQPFTAGRTIDLGTASAGSLSLTGADIDRIAAEVLRFGDATSGDITISAAISPAQAGALSLVTGGSIVDGNAAAGADVTVASLAMQAGNGIGTDDMLELAVSTLALVNTAAFVSIHNTGALTIGTVDGVVGLTSGAGIEIETASPMIFAGNISAGGNLTATTSDTGGANADNITVRAGVSVQSTGGNVTLQAGDDVVLEAGATVSALNTLTMTAGHNDGGDGDGGLDFAAATLGGTTVNLNAINDIVLGVLTAAGSTVNVDATGGAVSLQDGSGTYQFAALDVTAFNGINLGAAITTSGAQTYNSAVTLTADTVLASTGVGNISFLSTLNGLFGLTVNTSGVTLFDGDIGVAARLGDLTTDAGGSTTLQSLTLRTSGTMTFNDPVTGAGGIRIDSNQGGGNTTFASTIDGGDWIIAEPSVLTFGGAVGGTSPLTGLQLTSQGTVAINGGLISTINLQRLRGHLVFDSATDTTTIESTGGAEILLGHSAANSVRSATDGEESVIVNTTGITRINGVVGDNNQRLAALTTDAGGTTELNGGALTLAGNTLTFDDAVVLGADTLITDAGAVTFNNTVDGLFALTIDAGGDVTFGDAAADAVGGTTPLASLAVTSGGTIFVNAPITTADGAVTFNADIMAIAAAINAGAGIVTLAPSTAGETISLGTEVAGSLSLTDAELDLITAAVLRIGSTAAGSITFNDTISPALTSTLSLITGDGIRDSNGGTDVQVANLALQSVNGIADFGDVLLETEVDTIAARNTTTGGITLLETFAGGALIVGTVDGVVGIRNEASTGFSPILSIQLETTDGDLTVNSDIFNQRRNIFLVAQEDNGGAGDSTFINNANIVNAADGTNPVNAQIDIRANNMTLAAGSTISSANRVILRDDPSSTATVAIDLGGADGANRLGLTDAELDTVTTAGVLQIGHSGSGDITVLTSIDPAGVSTLDLETGGAVLDGNVPLFGPVTVTNLAIRAGAGIGTAAGDLDVEVSNLAFSNAAGVVNIQDFTGLTIAAVDGLLTSANNGTTTRLEVGTVAGNLTFAVDTFSNGDADYLAVTSITVQDTDGDPDTGPAVTGNGTIAFDTPTVNLFGNVTAAGGITGTAMTINVDNETVAGTTGNGAEIQDAVGVALAGAAVGDNVTINVAAGTYASFAVTAGKTNLTVVGAGNDAGGITTVETGTPAITISANDTTVQDMLVTFGGAGVPGLDDVGILLNGDAAAGGTAGLTGINIVNVDFSNLYYGVDSTGNIGSGAGGTDVTIRGNSNADRAVFEDFQLAAIRANDVNFNSNARYLIQDLIIQDHDGDGLASLANAILLGFVGAATIQGVNMTHNVAFDGIFLLPATLTDADILIGGPGAEDANTIRGLHDGIDTGALSGGTFVVQGNTLIFGADDAIDFNLGIVGGTDVDIVDNAEITGNVNGVSVRQVTDSMVTISGNTLIRGLAGNAIEFDRGIGGASTVMVSDNVDLLGTLFGIEFRDSIGGTAAVTVDGNGTATHNGVAYDGTAPVNLANFLVTGAITGGAGGITVHDITGDATVTLSRNMISGGGNGVDMGSVGSTGTTAVHNNFILDNGGNGVAFNGDISSLTQVFQNFLARNGGNGVLVGPAAAIGAGNLLVQQNFLPASGFANGNGGFGFNMLGAGTPDIEANWWGSPFLAQIVPAIHGVPVPALVLLTGTDTNVPAPGFGATALDPFAFQNQLLTVPLIVDPPLPGFDPEALLIDILAQTNSGRTPGDIVSGRAGLDSDNPIANIFADPFSLFGTDSLAGLAPAAGGESCRLIAIEDGLRLTCTAGGQGDPGNPADLAPAAGGEPASPAPAIDPGLTLDDLLNIWLYEFGTPLDAPAADGGTSGSVPAQADAFGLFWVARLAESH